MATEKKIQTTLVIKGDSKDGVRQLNLTGKELDSLLAKQNKTISVSKQMSEGYGKVTQSLSKYAMVAGGAVVAAGVAMVVSQMPVIDRLAKVSDQLGMATEKLVGYQHAANMGGVSNEQFVKAMQTMTKNIGDASMGIGRARVAIDELGLSSDEFFKLNTDQQYELISDKIAGLDSAQQKAAIASKIFGDAGIDLVNTLNLGSAGIAELARQTDIAGTALTRIDAAKVEQASDALSTAKMLGTGFAQQITVAVSPVITDLATRVFGVAEEMGGMASVAEKVFGYVITAAGFVGDAFRGVQIIVKGIQVVVAGIATAAINSFGMVIEGYRELANLIPGIKINYEETGFGRLEQAVSHTFTTLTSELNDLMLAQIPSQKLDAYIADVTRASVSAAEAVIDSNVRMAESSDEITISSAEMTKIQDELIGRYHPLQAATKKYEDELAKLAKVQGQIADEDYARILAGIEKAYRDTTNAITGSGSELGKIQDELIGRYNPLQAATAKYNAELAKLKMLHGTISQSDYDRYLSGIENSYRTTALGIAEAERKTRVLGSQSELLAKSYEEALKRVDASFARAWSGAGEGFDKLAGDLKKSMKDLLGELAHQAITQPILVKLGMVTSSGGLSAPGTGGSVANSLLGTGVGGIAANSLIGAGVSAITSSLLKGVAGSASFVGPLAPTGAGAAAGLGGTITGALGSAASSVMGVLSAIPGWGWALAGLALLGNHISKGDGWKRASIGFSVGPQPVVKDKHEFGKTEFASGLDITLINRRGSEEAANVIATMFQAIDAEAVRLVELAGGRLNLKNVDLAGTHADFGVNNGNFFGLRGGKNGLEDEGALLPLLSSFTRQILQHVEGLDEELMSVLQNATGTAEQILAQFADALALREPDTQAVAEALQAVVTVETELASTLVESVKLMLVTTKAAANLQSSIRDQIYTLQGIALLSQVAVGDVDGRIAEIAQLRQAAVASHAEQMRMEQELYNRRLSLTRDLKDYAISLQIGDKSILSPADQLTLAQKQFRKLSDAVNDETLSNEERLAAGEGLKSAGDSYLDAARGMFASSGAYKDIFREVLGVVENTSALADPGAAFDPTAANNALISELNSLRAELAVITSDSTNKVVDELVLIKGFIEDLAPDLAAAISATMGVFMRGLESKGTYTEVIADKIPKGTLAESGANDYLGNLGLGAVDDYRSKRNDSIPLADIAAYVAEVEASGASWVDKVTAVYTAAIENGVGSGQLAEATSYDQQEIIDAVVGVGLPPFNSYVYPPAAPAAPAAAVAANDGDKRNESASSAEIASYVTGVMSSGASWIDQIKMIYDAANDNGIGSKQLAEATGFTQQEIIDAALSAGLPSFSGGGRGTGPESGWLALMHGTEDVMPVNGSGGIRDLITEIQGQNKLLRLVSDNIETVQQAIYNVGMHAAEQREALKTIDNSSLTELQKLTVRRANGSIG